MKVIIVLLGGQLVEVLEDHPDNRMRVESNYGEGAEVLYYLENNGEWFGPEGHAKIHIRTVR